MKKKFDKDKIFYISIIILVMVFITGSYLAFVKFQTRGSEKVTIPEQKPKPMTNKTDENLTSKDWVWVSTSLENSQIFKPRMGEFKLKFYPDNSFTSSTDCNNISGVFYSRDGSIQFENIVATLKYCTKSLEGTYIEQLQNSKNYKFNEKKQLIIELKDDSGFMIFN